MPPVSPRTYLFPNQILKTWLAAVLVTSYATARASSADALLDQNLQRASRDTQNLPQDAAWFSSSSERSVSAGETGLNLTIGSVGRLVLCYFTNAEPAEIPEGGSLTLRIVFQVAEPQHVDTGFRFGIFNSGESRIATDGLSNDNPAFRDYSGYAVFSDFLPSSGRSTNIRRRHPGIDGSLILKAADCYKGLAEKGGGAVAIQPDKDYVAEFILKRDSSGIQATYRLSHDGELLLETEVHDVDEAPHAFDCVAFGAMSKACQSIILKKVTVVLGKEQSPK